MRVRLEKLMISQLVKKFAFFVGDEELITVCR
jgi:hypothetical protein